MIRIVYILLLANFIFSESRTWYTNPIDYVFGRTSSRMTFRDPLESSPFDFKMGIYTYGGNDYWNQSFGSNNLSSSPIILDSLNYEYSGLSDIKSRTLYAIEIDFLKYNLPNYIYKQNYVDVQFGLGYKLMGLLDKPGINLPSYFQSSDPYGIDRGNYRYRPLIQDYNFNTTLNWLFYDFLLAYAHHSIGYSNVSIYESEGGDKYLYGSGIGESFGLGFKALLKSRYDRKKYKVTYGIEAKWISTVVNELNDHKKISPITGFNMKGMGLNFNFGIVYGGDRSSGDEGYQSMIKNDFISAVDQFQEFIDNNPVHVKRIKAQKMLEFCKQQKPYQEYDNGNSAFKSYDLDQAARWYESALLTSDPELSFEIVTKQKEIATILLDSAFNYIDLIGFNKSEKLIRKARALTTEIEDMADRYLSKIYLLKGDVFYSAKNYEVALENFNKAYKYNPKIRSKYIVKVRQVTNSILEQANKAKDNGDILFALSSLKRLIELRPELEEDFAFGIESLEKKIEEFGDKKMQNQIESFIESEKNKAKDRVYNKIEIGMTKDEVIELMGEPAFTEDKYYGNEVRELWFYLDSATEKYIQFYFEKNILKRINK